VSLPEQQKLRRRLSFGNVPRLIVLCFQIMIPIALAIRPLLYLWTIDSKRGRLATLIAIFNIVENDTAFE
jgi:hypothetical protein